MPHASCLRHGLPPLFPVLTLRDTLPWRHLGRHRGLPMACSEKGFAKQWTDPYHRRHIQTIGPGYTEIGRLLHMRKRSAKVSAGE